MSRTFRPYDLNQGLLLPPDLREWLPEGHLALFISDVVDELALSAIVQGQGYEVGDGRGTGHPIRGRRAPHADHVPLPGDSNADVSAACSGARVEQSP